MNCPPPITQLLLTALRLAAHQGHAACHCYLQRLGLGDLGEMVPVVIRSVPGGEGDFLEPDEGRLSPTEQALLDQISHAVVNQDTGTCIEDANQQDRHPTMLRPLMTEVAECLLRWRKRHFRHRTSAQFGRAVLH